VQHPQNSSLTHLRRQSQQVPTPGFHVTGALTTIDSRRNDVHNFTTKRIAHLLDTLARDHLKHAPGADSMSCNDGSP
jgi:hypothetical protein